MTGDPDSLEIRGNRCPRGDIFAREEVLAPKRIVTATVALCGESLITPYLGGMARIPVKTTGALPREKIPALLNHLYTLEVSAPIGVGDILITDFENTGIGVVFTRSYSLP